MLKELGFGSEFFFYGSSSQDRGSVKIDEPSECPQCKHAITPDRLGYRSYIDNTPVALLAMMYLCKNCFKPFVAQYRVLTDKSTKLIFVGPISFQKHCFEESIERLSPAFVKIYNQAWAAESTNLEEIAGIGYRKSLEFLIKDYLIHQMPEEQAKIEDLPLAKCITQYIDHKPLKLTAERCAWLGNDHTHYKQKHTDKDLADLKRLLNASVSWVHLMLVTEEAAEMEPAGQK